MNDSLPYIPFYVRDFTADGKVEAMTTEQVGAYTLLLCKAWLETPPCSIPNDDLVLAKWARVKPAAWKKLRPGVMACWTLDEQTGRYFQKRLKAEYDRLQESRDRRSKAGQNGNAKRWQSDRNATQMRSHTRMPMQLPMPEGGVGETDGDPGWLTLALGLWPRWQHTPELVDSWSIALAEHPPEAVETAIRGHHATSPYPTPTLADVVKLLGKSPKKRPLFTPEEQAARDQRLADAEARKQRAAGKAEVAS